MLDVPKKYIIASGLKLNRYRKLEADNYYQLVDAPVIASPHLQHWKFETQGIDFHLWFMGQHKLNKARTLKHFKAFAEEQISTMGSFPEPDYHFLFQVSAKSIYHGVEHANSTVIALGPGRKIHQERYQDFLGVSSHELFHAWNILKIRPKPLLPYDFSKESFFTEGYVAEGITTYYGDLFLVRSGVFDQAQYFKELDRLFKRHFENFGRFHTDLAQSSWDLWLDGYGGGAPDRKVSIYTKGALVALLLDLKLRAETENQTTLDHLMRYLWEHFGKPVKGYQTSDLIKFCNKATDGNYEEFFQRFVFGCEPLEVPIKTALKSVGCKLVKVPSQQLLKKWFGVRTSSVTGKTVVIQIDPQAPAQKQLSIQDQIVRINGKKPSKNLNKTVGKGRTLKLEIRRNGRKINLKIPRGKRQYFPQYRIEKDLRASPLAKASFEQWLKVKF
jgi:predicted metalloprotease with PDZ domain